MGTVAHAHGMRRHRILFAILAVLLTATSVLSAESVAILSSTLKDDKVHLETARQSTVDVYTQYETEKGNEIIILDDYHVPKGVETLYIIAHGWEREEGSKKGFVYVGADNEEHWMNWENYLVFLDNYSDIETLVINSCMAGAAVRIAKEKRIGFDIYASCSEDEAERAFMTHPLEYALAYVSGDIPEIIDTFGYETHPVSYKAPHKDETRPPYLY